MKLKNVNRFKVGDKLKLSSGASNRFAHVYTVTAVGPLAEGHYADNEDRRGVALLETGDWFYPEHIFVKADNE